MIEEHVRVIGIEGDQLILQAQTKAACDACEVKQGCGTSVLAKVVGRKFTHFQAANTVNACVGDEVVVGLSEDAMLKGSIFVYLLPLLALITAAVLADSLLAADAGGRDLLVILSSAAGFIGMLAVSRQLLSTGSNRRRLNPVVLRKNISTQ